LWRFQFCNINKTGFMNKNVNLIATSAIIAIFLMLGSCAKTYVGSGEAVTVSRDAGKFTAVVLSMDATLNVTDSAVNSCSVSAQQNLQEAIITRLDGNTLVITSKGTIVSDVPIVINVSMNRTEMFEVNGSGRIIGMNTLKNDKMDFEVNGSGNIKLDLVTDHIACAVTGSGNLDLSGKTNSFDVEINGSGIVNAYNLQTLTSKAKINGSGECYLTVDETLKATVSGSGNIKYKGNPKTDKNVSGSGTIEQTN
jgi:hypothetical protein